VSKLDLFSPATAAWFNTVFDEPTPAQDQGWQSIVAGDHTLIHAPTGSGKTLAAFLWALDRLATSPPPPNRQRCRILYVSPLKALAYDIDRNLRAPLKGIGVEARRLGIEPPSISVAMRTGDTPQSERRAMLSNPPDLLITTPESLYLMLTSRAREILVSVDTVIIDEIHAVAGTKRGSHLALSLERLTELTQSPPQRIGLSATQRPLKTLAQFLGGGTVENGAWEPRPVTIVDTPSDKTLDIEIVVPVLDMTRPETDAPDQNGPRRRSIWPAVYPELLRLVNEHSSTLLFVNSRGLAERLAAELNRLAEDEVVQAHHGSVSREKRIDIEDRLKRGELKGVVATGTLELGIDMAAVDLVVLVESPSSVARGLQRVGRAGHQVGAPSVAKVFPKHRGDLLEATVVVDRMYKGDIESTAIPQNPIDVLAQQIVAMTATRDLDVDEAFDLLRGAYPFRSLTRQTFESVLDMLSGRYPSDDFAELRPRIVWDRAAGALTARSNAKLLAVTNPGTIPDRGLYTVHLPDGGRVGELDEEMVYESRPGDTFILGSTTWRIDEITRDRVIVTPSRSAPGARMPFWHGDAPGRPLELGRAVGAFTREIGSLDTQEASSKLVADYRLDPWAADNLASYLAEERAATGHLPTDRTIVVQRFKDEIGDWRIVLLSPFGGRVHAPWALAVRNRLRTESGAPVDAIWSDDGILFRFPDQDAPPDTGLIYLDPDDVEELLISEVADSALFTSKFREAAARALLLPRRRPGSRTPLWLQRRKAANLLEITRNHGSFPIMLETYREVMQDYFDLPALKEILTEVQKRTTRVVEVDRDGPSPFASSLMFDFIASFMYEYDAPVAERRAAALALDRSLLADLLGEPEFRDLLDTDAIASVEADLQHLSQDRRARSADAVSDMLRDVGPLTSHGVARRITEPQEADTWLDELIRTGRAILAPVNGTDRYIAVEDIARLRDTIGVQPPPGVATALLEPVTDPLGDIVGRYARTHGPFTTDEAAESLGLPVATVAEVLHRLEHDGRLTAGAYRPGGTEREWVSIEVLRRLRRRTLAALAQQVEAVDRDAYVRFLPAWQRVGPERSTSLIDAVRRLAGAVIPASILETDILAARLDNPERDLDAALATGDIVWVGREPLGTRDGRVALYLRDSYSLLAPQVSDTIPDSRVHVAILEHLANRGASFFPDLYNAARGGSPDDVAQALWDLVWSGVVTCDSISALRAFTRKRRRSATRRQLPPATPPHASGRWYLTETLCTTEPTAEERAVATINTLLDRHGIVTRDVVLAEGVPGGFTGLYPVLSGLEDVGDVRRGYFIEGLGGAQFGLPGAIDRLRVIEDTGIVVLASADPANPYGGVLPWPDTGGRPTRTAGSRVAIDNGTLVAWMDRPGMRVCVFSSETDRSAAGIEALASAHGKASIEQIDGISVHDHEIVSALSERGFRSGYKGYTLPTVQHLSRR
jgi:ATP-dependent Lhr-like helicase